MLPPTMSRFFLHAAPEQMYQIHRKAIILFTRQNINAAYVKRESRHAEMELPAWLAGRAVPPPEVTRLLPATSFTRQLHTAIPKPCSAAPYQQ